jgi:hypothetical protein
MCLDYTGVQYCMEWALTVYSELAREKMWARIHLIPALQAEEDRDQVRRYLADRAREKELLGSETRVYNSDRYVIMEGHPKVFPINKPATDLSDRPSQSPQRTRRNKASHHRRRNSYRIVHTRAELTEGQTPHSPGADKHPECNIIDFHTFRSLSNFPSCHNSWSSV